MCKSRAQGGQRCATHTSVPYLKALSIANSKEELSLEEQIILGSVTIDYATTLKGMKVIEEDIELFDASGRVVQAAILRTGLAEGLKRREVTKELELQIYCEQQATKVVLATVMDCQQQGLNAWEAYQKILEISDEMTSQMSQEMIDGQVVPEEILNHRKRISNLVSKNMKSIALTFYTENASPEEISANLEHIGKSAEEDTEANQEIAELERLFSLDSATAKDIKPAENKETDETNN